MLRLYFRLTGDGERCIFGKYGNFIELLLVCLERKTQPHEVCSLIQIEAERARLFQEGLCWAGIDFSSQDLFFFGVRAP